MNLEDLRTNIITAKKEGNIRRSSVLTMVLDVSQKIAKGDGDREVSSIDIVGAAKRLTKQGKQSADAGIDVADELDILEEFVPKPLDEAKTRHLITNIISNTDSPTMPIVMKELRKHNVDMKLASKITQELLA